MQWLMYHFHFLHTLAPATNDHTSALRVTISVAAPSLVLLASGYPELTIYAVCIGQRPSLLVARRGGSLDGSGWFFLLRKSETKAERTVLRPPCAGRVRFNIDNNSVDYSQYSSA